MKGVKLQGVVTWFDSFSLLLRRDGASQLVYKHAISTIMPAQMPAGFTAAATITEHGGKAVAAGPVSSPPQQARREQMTLFLVNGVMLQGQVAGFDQFSVLLERGGQIQLVYKHAISTLQPEHPLDLDDGHAGETAEEAP